MHPLPRSLRIAAVGSLIALAPVAARALSAETWNDLALRRAAALLTQGDAASAADVLAARDSSSADPRADFLEAWAARSLGQRDTFERLTAQLRARGGDFARWADVLARIDAARVAPGLRAEGDAPAESLAAHFDLDLDDAAKAARPLGADAKRARHEAAAAGLTALRERRLEDAQRLLGDAETSWRADDHELEALASPSDSLVDAVFEAWDTGGADERSVRLEVAGTEAALRSRVEATLDLTKQPHGNVDAPSARATVDEDARLLAPLPAPAAAERRRADELASELSGQRATLQADRRRLTLATRDAERAAQYYLQGLDAAAEQNRALDAAAARFKALVARSGEIVAQLAAIRDEETRRVATRVGRRFLDICRDQLLVTNALVRFRVEGPAARHPEPLPPDVPSPAELLHEETLLAAALEGWLSAFAARAPELVVRSHDEIWKPRATDGLRALADAVAREAARADAVAAAIDSTRAFETAAARYAEVAQAVDASERRERELVDALRTERRRVVVAAVDAARDAHRREGEGILYGAAATAHELALAQGDVDDATARGRSRVLLADAKQRYRAFLDVYPQSTAKSEVRFRLADVLLNEGREDFHEAMTRFLGTSGAATESDERALAPFVDYGPALEIYLGLLADDPTFAHRDAVLYHAGMILADQNEPAGLQHLATLVHDYPTSPHAQEAHLRLGDDLLSKKSLREALAHYEAAASGRDVEHSAIALYHAGWVRFQLDDFDGSADSFRKLMLLYDAHPDAARTTDLRDEAEDHLVQALARGGGARAFERLFPANTPTASDARILARLGDLFREYSRFGEAVSTDSLWLERWPDEPRALDAARRLAATLERAERPDAAREARLDWADQFREGSRWWKANEADSLRRAGDDFARNAYVGAAVYHHHLARDKNDGAEWVIAADHYAALLSGWPNHGSAPAWRYGAGEAAISLDRYEDAVKRFEEAAASDTASFRVDAAWHAVAARDAWYESGRPPAVKAGAERGPGPENLARSLDDAIDRFVTQHPEDSHVADLLWRRGHVARTHGWSDEAVVAFARLGAEHPNDKRALDSSRLAAQLLVDREEFRKAGDAYAVAARLARATGRDSIAVELEKAVPTCAYRDAESVVKKKGEGEESARLFEDVAARYPKFADAPRALYRAGAGWAAAGQTADAVRVWTQLGERYPKNELARDAALETARAWKAAGRTREAASSSEHFAQAFPDDPDAAAALLDAAELAGAAGDSADAQRIEDAYVAKHPKDVETALVFLERRAQREVAAVTPERPISVLLAPATRTKPASATRRWLDLAEHGPDAAARPLLAQVGFLRGEEARRDYERVRLSLPLGPSVAKKKSLLEKTLQEYRSCAAHETAPWNRAAAARIGECLVGFGDALMASQRPADLGEDDLKAYEDELEKKSFVFFDRGEEVWTQLLQHAGDAPGDEWVERARRELWPRVAKKFSHLPEVDYPLVPAAPPGESP